MNRLTRLLDVNWGEKWNQFNAWLPWNRLPPEPRIIHFNDPVLNSRGENKFCDNSVSTSKYSPITFIPKNLFEQFKRVANIYFLIIAILQIATPFSPTGRYSTGGTLIIVILVQMIKDAYEDIKRKISDAEVNNRDVTVVRGSSTQAISWKEVRVGDIVKVNQDENFPADLIALSSSEHQGICYIETSQLDGETNLKIKRCVAATSELKEPEMLNRLKGMVQCEQPNNKLYNFTGTLKLDAEPKPIPVDVENILLRGAQLKNTKYVYGLVVFTGKHSKLMMNSRNPPSKRSKVEKITNKMILVLFLVQCVLTVFSAAAITIWDGTSNPRNNHWYIRNTTSLASEFFGGLLTFFILYNGCIPISLYVTLETVKVIQARVFIDSDLKMCYYDKSVDLHIPAAAKTSSLNEELGQVEYIFSDKTGTLTQNVMEFLKFSVCGVEYGTGTTEIGRAAAKRRGEVLEEEKVEVSADGFQFTDHRILHGKWKEEKVANEIEEFLTLLAVCHTVVPEIDSSDPNKIIYQASSPDEAALVKAAQHLGFVFKERNTKKISIDAHGVTKTYEVLNILEFNSTRKRMSAIVKTEDGQIILYTKGADNVIYDRMRKDQPYAKETRKLLEKHAAEGLRTLVCAKVVLDPEAYHKWNTEVYEPAELDLQDKKQKLADAAELIEKNLELVGTTAIEDKLQDEVPETISTLAKARIKIWVLTGDKQETAINIGYACALLDNDMSIILINAENRGALKTQIRTKLENALSGKEGSVLGLVVDGAALDIILEKKKKKKNKKKKDDAVNLAKRRESTLYLGASLSSIDTDQSNDDDADDPNEEPLRLTFLRLCMLCKSVICCRVSPLQKSLIVKLVKDNLKGAVTLAIGDGANDVSMIQAAHIGVGISGKEGLQAARAADYAIAQFKYLQRLLLVHGRLNYRRICKTINYSFYKNLTLQFTQFYFIFFNAFSGTSLYENMSLAAFNVIFASLPIIGYALYDKDVNDEHSIAYPELYTYGQTNHFFNLRKLLLWILNAIWHSLIIFFIPMGIYAFTNNTLLFGIPASMDEIGTLVYTCVILTVNMKLALETTNWNIVNFVLIWGTIASWFLWTVLYSVFYWVVPKVDFSVFNALKYLGMKYYFLFYTTSGNALFWLSLILVIVMVFGRDFAWKSAVRYLPFSKQLYHVLQPYEKIGQVADRKVVEKQFDVEKLQAPTRKAYDKFGRIGKYITQGTPIEHIEGNETVPKQSLVDTQFGTGYAFSQREGEKELIEELCSGTQRSGAIQPQSLLTNVHPIILDPITVGPHIVEENDIKKKSKRKIKKEMKKEMKKKLTKNTGDDISGIELDEEDVETLDTDTHIVGIVDSDDEHDDIDFHKDEENKK
ncbi:hypothetical protein ABK040_006924 [Willaertia magna]